MQTIITVPPSSVYLSLLENIIILKLTKDLLKLHHAKQIKQTFMTTSYIKSFRVKDWSGVKMF